MCVCVWGGGGGDARAHTAWRSEPDEMNRGGGAAIVYDSGCPPPLFIVCNSARYANACVCSRVEKKGGGGGVVHFLQCILVDMHSLLVPG